MLTIVVPVLNERESVAELHRQLVDVSFEHGDGLQIIFVDDGSTDGTWDVIEQLAASDPQVLGIRFRRNFGKAAALSAGFDEARGDYVVMLDGDLQDIPAEIPKLLHKLDEGFDVVSGWKQPRRDPWDKVWPSLVFNWLVSRLTGVHLHDHNCGLKAFRREVIHEIRLYGQLHRFVPVLAAARGFRVTEVAVGHRPREFGRSKYGAGRFVQALLDLLTVKFITGYGDRPQHLLGTVGFVSFVCGCLGMFALAVRWCATRMVESWEPVHLHETAALFYSLALCLVGAQFLSIGLLGEMIAAYLSRDTDTYSIVQHTLPEREVKKVSSGQ
jgi:dolichol-phosphate mannosyltransferase